MRPKRILVTLGDPDGIGPELVAKLIHSRILRNSASLEWLLVGSEQALARYTRQYKTIDRNLALTTKRADKRVALIAAPAAAPKRKLSLAGYQSGWSIETAVNLILAGQADAIVTGPIDKSRLKAGGYPFPGHTEFLAHLCGQKSVTMMLANDTFRVSLVTTHLALSRVSRSLSLSQIETTILHTVEGLKNLYHVKTPRIAVLALNPHCGEKGQFGREEIDVIQPALRSITRRNARKFTVSGPHSADTFFANELRRKPSDRHDAIVCMYHDQGLIPVKLVDFGRTVNVTLGLPIIRTSVDHGVGFDIAGKGVADPSSFAAAALLARDWVRRRR